MSFLTPMFLVGLGGMLLPVLIHLLTRDRIRRVEFSTLRFFAKASGRVLRRKRFRELALMLLRAVVCGLLATSFARPLLKGDGPDDPASVRARTARVILADVSASMGRAGASEQLRRVAREALEELSERQDAVAVLTFTDSAVVEAPLATDFDRAVEAVDTLTPTEGATDLPQALRAANEHLQRARAARREIVLVSDLQRSGWQQLKEDFRLSPGVKLIVRPVGVEQPNGAVAILSGSFPESAALDGEMQLLGLQLVNYSSGSAEGVEVTFRVGGQAIRRTVSLRPGGTAVAAARHVFEVPGDNPGQAEAVGIGTWHFNTRVIPKIKVALLDGASEGGRPSEGAFYMDVAIQPDDKTPTPFDARTVDASRATPADLADARVAVLVNVRTIPPALRQALRGLLRRGGGLWLLPGDRCEPQAFAEAFADLAPCKLRGVRTGQLRAGGVGAALWGIDFQHPIFEPFSHPRHGDLSLARFRRYWEVTDSQLSQVLAKFDDNRPAVIARPIEGGVSMMLACCPTAAWTDLPRQTTFLPYVWQTLKYLAARTEQRTAYFVGEAMPVPEGCRLIGPDGRDASNPPVARKAGLYVVRDADGRGVITYAVNRSPAEADPAVVAADEIVAAVQRPEAEAPAATAAAGQGERPKGDDRGLWWWVVTGVVVLLLAELLLGNKTLRH